MDSNPFPEDQEEFRDKISTVDDTGKRVWVFPKKPAGRFYNARIWLSLFLLILLIGIPFIKVGGEPIMLFNVLERRFILFGIHFMPQDFHLFGLAMLTLVVFIILFTVVFGRIFCGWVCPQTIFMELVFRRIEYWIEGDANQQRKLAASPWTTEKAIRKLSKHAIFFAIAVVVSNTFLAWIIGADQVMKIATDPLNQHMGGFIAMLVFSFAFYFVFSYLREQVCIAICPYGRLQGVLLGKDSIVIAYDHVRGEPRGKIRKEAPKAAVQAETKLGDCIDCKLCVHVCPTGIDIRNGTQLECINCTACIDACDEVMDKIERPRGLIRYDSFTGIEEGRKKIFTPRVIAYSVLLGILLIVNILLLGARTDIETNLFRTGGSLFNKVDEQTLSNTYNYTMVNKTREDMPVEFRLAGSPGEIKVIGKAPVAQSGEKTEGTLLIYMQRENLSGRKTELHIEVYSNGELVDKTKTNFFGPGK
ncbi:MAG: cytochrome c oxidase accessory protein CcoG [Saprospirales bacterium]|nr:cytochrome c oxidase accessory protein CcoG [Saprospirales bacterium]